MADKYSLYTGKYGSAGLSGDGINLGLSWKPIMITTFIFVVLLICCFSSAYVLRSHICKLLNNTVCKDSNVENYQQIKKNNNNKR